MLDATVRDLAAQRPPIVAPDARLGEVAHLIATARTESAVVVEDGRAIGIVTEHDLVTRVLAKGTPPQGTIARDVMTHPVRTIPSSAPIAEAARIMARHHVRHIPIIDDNDVVGMVTDRDLLALSPVLFEALRESDGPLGGRAGANGPNNTPSTIEGGVCQGCETIVPSLRPHNGDLLCDDCAEAADIEPENE